MEQSVVTGHRLVNGGNVYYEFYPNQNAKTVVLLHGFLSSTFTFRHLIPLLVSDYQVLSIDLPPFGKSEKSRRYVYSYKNLAQTVIQMIDYFSIKDPVLIGHSMGGQVVLNILHLMPGIAEKAVLLSSSSYLKRLKWTIRMFSYVPFSSLFVKLWLARIGVVKNLQDTLYNHSLINNEMIDGYLQPFLQNKIFSAMTRMIRDWEGDLPSKVLNQINANCLLIWGEHDRSQPLHVGERLKNDLINSELVVLKETGHAIPEERPYEIYEYIKRFLKD
ncbi:hydrolase [Heyndrickxia shackletonii]|uniref:Hydrolase n=1 Tax=Heyndrickxia shackletonii TaxID=157838 RepID=A0A0Q3TLP0_9BACI|nr:alpha/beta hydrolase [Heyndrickxia shackletonii]KQL54886.1 hydrolase [Heyndrickxia shackletonii]NEY99450.1 alpha/beta hydrolase [Heyndrickxia shackletonii]